MPAKSRKVHCQGCGFGVGCHDNYCSNCGAPMPAENMDLPRRFDIAHPITRECREWMEEAVFDAYKSWCLEDGQ